MRSSKSTELAKMDEVNIVNLHTASDSALFYLIFMKIHQGKMMRLLKRNYKKNLTKYVILFFIHPDYR